MRRQLCRVAFVGEPEAALAVGGDAFEVELLRRIAAAGDDQSCPVISAGVCVASMVKMDGCAP